MTRERRKSEAEEAPNRVKPAWTELSGLFATRVERSVTDN